MDSQFYSGFDKTLNSVHQFDTAKYQLHFDEYISKLSGVSFTTMSHRLNRIQDPVIIKEVSYVFIQFQTDIF